LWQMLATGKIYFLRTTKWDDPFEAFLAKRYCAAKARDFDRINSDKYFLCCTTKPERDHFWRNYTPNKDGVRVTFDLSSLQGIDSRIIAKDVSYPPRDEIRELLKNIVKKTLSEAQLTDLYFIKRRAFEDEDEYRLMLKDKSHGGDAIGIDFQPDTVITRILFDPRIDAETYERHKRFIHNQFGKLPLRHSRLYNPEKAFPEMKRTTTASTIRLARRGPRVR
jgi:hypothetical protein